MASGARRFHARLERTCEAKEGEVEMKASAKSQRNYKLMEFLVSGHTINEAADEFGISRQRVSQLAHYFNLDLGKIRKEKNDNFMEQVAPFLGTMRDTDLAKRFNVSATVISYARKKLGIPIFLKPIGCEKCKTHPYAKGLCRACHSRSFRKGRKARSK
jgi:hypothetical protein